MDYTDEQLRNRIDNKLFNKIEEEGILDLKLIPSKWDSRTLRDHFSDYTFDDSISEVIHTLVNNTFRKVCSKANDEDEAVDLLFNFCMAILAVGKVIDIWHRNSTVIDLDLLRTIWTDYYMFSFYNIPVNGPFGETRLFELTISLDDISRAWRNSKVIFKTNVGNGGYVAKSITLTDLNKNAELLYNLNID